MALSGWFESRVRQRAAVATIALTVLAGAGGLGAAGATMTSTRTFYRASAQGYSGVLTNAAHRSLYVLSVEKGGHIHCASACLTSWPPLLVNTAKVTFAKGKGVKGRFGLVKRSTTERQVTFNGYPVYTFIGDSGARQARGQGISADGGTWRLINAGATNPSATPDTKGKAIVKSTTTTVKSYGY